ncbi:hypothetical protein SAMN04488559_11341 [Isobaculum melis]|uniref:Uncharacterized protein n=1 Tax=Isobaculum melis TaxID=142588 RepID=A0A1H9THT5_9LACT|nr:hypothetical protein SAMN04488559_11341 [Isobaculum melis]
MNFLQMYGFMFFGVLIYGVLGLVLIVMDEQRSIKASVRRMILKRRAYKAYKAQHLLHK